MRERRTAPRALAAVALAIAVATVQLLAWPSSPAVAAPADNCLLPAPTGVFHEHAGPTNYSRWLRPQGNLRAVFLFVDFADAVGTAADMTDRRRLFETQAADWVRASSYGRVSLSFTFTAAWHRMPKPQTAYQGHGATFENHRTYMQDAVTASDAAVDFRPFQLIYVVSPRSATVIHNSPAFIADPGWGLFADGVERRHGANFGTDTDYWGYRLLNHETGHVFGLPDLYRYGVQGPQMHEPVGGWDLMGTMAGPAPDHFAWHKWKMGWLDDAQIYCQTTRGVTSRTLTPLGTTGGLKAFVVKVAPQRAIVVESRQPSALDVTSSCFKPGVLVYLVDTTVGGGNQPIRVLDRLPNNAVANCSGEHAELDNATLVSVNHEVTDPASRVRVRLTGISGSDRTVQVTW